MRGSFLGSLTALSLPLLGLLGACSAGPSSDELVGSTDDALSQLPPTVIESALDRGADPCQDFFQFACGGYLASTKLVSDDDVHSLMTDDAQAANDDAIDQIVSAMVAHPVTPEDHKVADYMAACVAYQSQDFASWTVAGAFADEVAAVRAAQSQGLSALVAQALRSGYGRRGQPLLRLLAQPDRNHDPSHVAAFVEPAAIWSRTVESVTRDLETFYPDLSPQDRAARAASVVAIDASLRDILATWDGHDERPLGRDGVALAMPHLDWPTIFASLGLGHAERVYVNGLDALTKVDAYLASASLTDLGNYVEFEVLREWFVAVDPPSPDDPDLIESSCNAAVATDLAGILEHRFVDTVMGKKNTTVALAMAKKVLAAFDKRLQSTEFLDASTKIEALTKLRSMAITPLSMPRDTYSDVTLRPTSFVANKLAFFRRNVARELARVDHRPPPPAFDQADGYDQVNAFYDPTENRFTILPGIAHGGFFGGAAAPAAHNFGALGWVIGHEMTHGFDDTGRMYDAYGADRNWWSPASEAAFKAEADCFVRQYGGFTVDGVVDPATQQPAHLDGAKTLGENIADNGGIRSAYEAAEEYFAKGTTVAGFSPEQQFFIAGGQSWCEKVGPDFAKELLDIDVHSPGKARVNVTLSNFDKFGETFHCKAGDQMMAAPVCKIW